MDDTAAETIASLRRALEATERARAAHQAHAATLQELVRAQAAVIVELDDGDTRLERMAREILRRR